MWQVYRTANIEAKLISLEGRFSAGFTGCQSRRAEIEEVARVERVVAQELEQFAVIIVTPLAGRDVDDGPGVATIFGAES